MQGWLKGLNSTAVDHEKDMGANGTIPLVARDVLGFGLHYYDNGGTEYDYKNMNGANPFARPNNSAFKSLYNGNIAGMTVNNAALAKGGTG